MPQNSQQQHAALGAHGLQLGCARGAPCAAGAGVAIRYATSAIALSQPTFYAGSVRKALLCRVACLKSRQGTGVSLAHGCKTRRFTLPSLLCLAEGTARFLLMDYKLCAIGELRLPLKRVSMPRSPRACPACAPAVLVQHTL